eukprot:114557_1
MDRAATVISECHAKYGMKLSLSRSIKTWSWNSPNELNEDSQTYDDYDAQYLFKQMTKCQMWQKELLHENKQHKCVKKKVQELKHITAMFSQNNHRELSSNQRHSICEFINKMDTILNEGKHISDVWNHYQRKGIENYVNLKAELNIVDYILIHARYQSEEQSTQINTWQRKELYCIPIPRNLINSRNYFFTERMNNLFRVPSKTEVRMQSCDETYTIFDNEMKFNEFVALKRNEWVRSQDLMHYVDSTDCIQPQVVHNVPIHETRKNPTQSHILCEVLCKSEKHYYYQRQQKCARCKTKACYRCLCYSSHPMIEGVHTFFFFFKCEN